MIFRILMLIFSILGSVYAVVGGALLFFATQAPSDVRALSMIGYVFLLTGVGFLLAALVFFLLRRKQQASIEELRTYGLLATGSITAIEENRHITRNNCPYQYALVTCLHPVTRKETVLKSESFPQITRAIGDRVDVYFDNYDEKRYWIAMEESDKR